MGKNIEKKLGPYPVGIGRTIIPRLDQHSGQHPALVWGDRDKLGPPIRIHNPILVSATPVTQSLFLLLNSWKHGSSKYQVHILAILTYSSSAS
jgi:hypothetical protein